MVIDDGGAREALVEAAMDRYLSDPDLCHCPSCERAIRGYFSRKSVAYLTSLVERKEGRVDG